MNKAALLRSQIYRDILRENNGSIPRDFLEQIEDRVGDKLDEYADTLINSGNTSTKLSVGKISNSLPNAADYKDVEFEDENTGKIYKSDGKKWITK